MSDSEDENRNEGFEPYETSKANLGPVRTLSRALLFTVSCTHCPVFPSVIEPEHDK
ncbi:hypothetical protein HFX_1756 [Haloferax mediterranei ATCC 33500]|uniref:Uncharacterized protein n=1 Tax=Haloferax mediterranei (strain ATCC 33500 / DSM 1411 / JCM 8866 / NBRC 14739 / NCIMB 2177 / R-4) TaxID=523841 RepID=I3R5F2_HALMT|nr:hypothetical protein HFX_1756 [Haloferax mediterranei ATCC 33500]